MKETEELKNKYKGKKISILGDSISTLENYNPLGYNVFYRGEHSKESNVKNYEDTWWGELIETLSCSLLSNDSWSGSLVSAEIGSDNIFPSASSDERTSNLHVKNIKPDIIIIYIGINDYSSGVRIDGIKREKERYNYRYFSFAYDKMLYKIKKNYPDAQIMCCTISTAYIMDKPKFVFPTVYLETPLEDFNETIIKTAQKHGCKVLDIAKYNTPYESIDSVHPTKKGMHTLSNLMLLEIKNNIE